MRHRWPRAVPSPRPILLGAAASLLALSCAFHVQGTAETGASSSATTGTGGVPGTGGAATTGTTTSTATSSAGGAGGMTGTGGMGGHGGMPPVCGDGKVEGTEACDDGNTAIDDGCADCAVQLGYSCSGAPSACVPIPPQIVVVGDPTPIGLTITDKQDHYDGSIATMDCATVTLVDQGFPVVHRVILEVGIDHPYVGDLVLKLVSPKGTISTMMSRPGLNEPADKYDESNGYSPHLSAGAPITFDDNATDDAEQMGKSLGGGTVCQDDQHCQFHPNHGAGPGVMGLADFNGESPAGDWKVCLADGDDNDVGTLQKVKLTVLAWQK
ncbi:MAG: proprotein convertase P-domain-containing protein [Minicystis sp.]